MHLSDSLLSIKTVSLPSGPSFHLLPGISPYYRTYQVFPSSLIMAMATRTKQESPVQPLTTAHAKATKGEEFHSARGSLHVEFEDFYGIPPSVVDRRFDISLSDSSYLPKVES